MGTLKEMAQLSLPDVNFKSELLSSWWEGPQWSCGCFSFLSLHLNAKGMGTEEKECIHNRSFVYTLPKSWSSSCPYDSLRPNSSIPDAQSIDTGLREMSDCPPRYTFQELPPSVGCCQDPQFFLGPKGFFYPYPNSDLENILLVHSKHSIISGHSASF